ncbi:MAG TPA: hypothetical protein VMW49_09260 [Candidatus Dormibacteraeota bacterium]|nr:hypothetical protein [Candidatus Dormibacteraeota bacterium]
MVAALAAVLLAACGTGAYTPPQVAQDESAAQALVADLAGARYAAATAGFDPQMQTALPAAGLETAWQQAGQGDLAVLVPVRMANGPLVVRVVFNPAGQVAGLFFQS